MREDGRMRNEDDFRPTRIPLMGDLINDILYRMKKNGEYRFWVFGEEVDSPRKARDLLSVMTSQNLHYYWKNRFRNFSRIPKRNYNRRIDTPTQVDTNLIMSVFRPPMSVIMIKKTNLIMEYVMKLPNWEHGVNKTRGMINYLIDNGFLNRRFGNKSTVIITRAKEDI